MTRPTFKQACEAVVEKSAIKAWLDGDRLQPWHVALDKDLEATKSVFAMLGADLSAITRRKVVVGFDFKPMIDKMMLRSFNSVEDRMREALSIFTSQFGAEIAKISSKIKALQASECIAKETFDSFRQQCRWVYTYFTFPLAAISLPNDSDMVKFVFTDEFKCRAVEYRLVDPRLQTLGEFSRPLPQRIQDKIGLLEKTHFDHRPMILDGYLAFAKEIASEVPSSRTGADPGLVIDLWDELVLVDYWYEPTRNRPITRLWYGLQRKIWRSWTIWTMLVILIIASTVMTCFRPWFFPVVCILLVFFIVCGAKWCDDGLNAFRTKADIYKPRRKLVM